MSSAIEVPDTSTRCRHQVTRSEAAKVYLDVFGYDPMVRLKALTHNYPCLIESVVLNVDRSLPE
jgi:hypothetical protein